MATASELIANIRGFFTPDVIGRLSTLVAETPAVTEKAMRSAVPAMLGGVLSLGSRPGGIRQVQGLLGANDRLPESYGSMLASDAVGLRQTGHEILGSLFGGKLDAVVESVAHSTGGDPSSVSSALALAAPFIMSLLGWQVRSQGLSAGELVGLLTSHKESITHLIPPSLDGLLGLPGIKVPDHPIVRTRTPNAGRATAPVTTRATARPGWWPWALGLALLLLLATWYAARFVR
jgi:OmpA-OmpF porin, OOP family